MPKQQNQNYTMSNLNKILQWFFFWNLITSCLLCPGFLENLFEESNPIMYLTTHSPWNDRGELHPHEIFQNLRPGFCHLILTVNAGCCSSHKTICQGLLGRFAAYFLPTSGRKAKFTQWRSGLWWHKIYSAVIHFFIPSPDNITYFTAESLAPPSQQFMPSVLDLNLVARRLKVISTAVCKSEN